MGAVHLGMMDLEADGQRGLEQSLAVSSPGEERIVPDAAILVNDAV